MKKTTFRTLTFVVALFAVAAFTSSCNRGYGCPNNFELDSAIDLDLCKKASYELE